MADNFRRLAEDYYRAWFRYHPEAAVACGRTEYGHLLTPFDEETSAALECLNDELLVALNEIDRARLDADAQIDFDLMYGAAWLENEQLLELLPYHVDPGRCLPINAIHQLTVLPVEDFPALLSGRLQAVPAHLASAHAYLAEKAARIPSIWLRSAVLAARHGAEFIADLAAHPLVAAASTRKELARQARDAAQALGAFADFLERDIGAAARGDFACGRAHFDHLLRYRHFLDIDADTLHAFGEALFAETAGALRAAAHDIAPEEDLATITRRIQANHPAPEQLLGVYREQMQAARAFVAARDLVSLPPVERLDVVETPVFLRHQIPFAAYQEPMPSDPRQQGYYYVTPPADAAQRAEHNYAGLMHTCVHEAWPGHHLQFVTANGNAAARTLPRLLNASATLYEGWALYCEQLMHEQGFLGRPEQRFLLLKDRLWRALRIVVDVEIHTRGLSLDAAADRMVQHLGFPREQAMADLTWYTRAPGIPMGYATGWALINAMRERAQTEPGFALKGFHDRLLSVGSIALPLVLQRAFGSSLWSGVRETVFQGRQRATA